MGSTKKIDLIKYEDGEREAKKLKQQQRQQEEEKKKQEEEEEEKNKQQKKLNNEVKWHKFLDEVENSSRVGDIGNDHVDQGGQLSEEYEKINFLAGSSALDETTSGL